MQHEQGGQAVLHVEHGKHAFLSVGKIHGTHNVGCWELNMGN